LPWIVIRPFECVMNFSDDSRYGNSINANPRTVFEFLSRGRNIFVGKEQPY